MNTKILFSRENESVILPTKRNGDAGFDLYADKDIFNNLHGRLLRIKPNQTVMIPTGLRSIVEEGYYIQIQERGSTGVKAMKYGAGVLDSSYRGIWNIVITNCNRKDVCIYEDSASHVHIDESSINYPLSKALAQFVVLPVPKVTIEEVSIETITSNKTERGEGKLGSSNK